MRNGINAYDNLAIIKQLVVPILGSKNLVAIWLIIMFVIPNTVMPKANSVSVIFKLSKTIGV